MVSYPVFMGKDSIFTVTMTRITHLLNEWKLIVCLTMINFFFICSHSLSSWVRLVETHLREQREGYESKLEALVFKNDHLSRENQQLQALFQEKSDINHVIGQEVGRLTTENMVACIGVYSHIWSSWWEEWLEGVGTRKAVPNLWGVWKSPDLLASII